MNSRARLAAARWPGGAGLSLACALLLVSVGLRGHAFAEEKASLPGIEKEFKEAIKRVTPATVVCLAKGANPEQGGSSGVIVSRKGLVLSDGDASRVVRVVGEGAARKRDDIWVDDVIVRVPEPISGTFKAYDAKVLKRVPEADSMLLRIVNPPAGGFPVSVPIGSSDDLQVGDFAFAVGNSFGLASEALPSLTAGVISSLVPFPEGHAEGRWETLYTSAAINPNVNGGPLVDLGGRLVGTISTWGEAKPDEPYQFLGKVIPVQRMRKHYGDLPEAAELFAEAKAQKEPAQASALEATFHAAAQTGYPAVASLIVERSKPWKARDMGERGKKLDVERFAGPVSALTVSARGELVTSLYNLTNVFTLEHPPGVGEVVDADFTLDAGLSTITQITACLADGRTYPVRIVGVDPRIGVVLLRAEIPGGDAALPVLQPAPPEAFREGRFALALGNPFGKKPLPSPLLTVGILSKVHAWSAPAAWRGNWQTDAPVTDANCGGALVGLRGELLGMLQIWSPLRHGRASGIGFVVPWSLIQDALPGLRAGKTWRRGRLGVVSAPESSPPVIEQVQPGSAADRAGLKAGDMVRAIDGRTPRDGADAIMTLRYRWGGERIRLTIERVGEKKPLEIDVTLEERPEDPAGVPAAPTPAAGPAVPPGDKPGEKPPEKPAEKPPEAPPGPAQPPAPTPDAPK